MRFYCSTVKLHIFKHAALIVLFVLFFVAAPESAQAQGTQLPETSGLANTAGLEDPSIVENYNLATETPLVVFIARLINVALGFLGIIMLALIIYGGWLYMTSAGNPDTIDKAKKIWRNAAIGLVIILSSFAITQFIMRALFGGGGGGLGQPGGPGYDIGVGALGDGLIESHYPERGQEEVPMNTSIIITFKEPLDPEAICGAAPCAGNDLNNEAIAIFATTVGQELYSAVDGSGNATQQGSDLYNAQQQPVDANVSSSADNRTFVITPKAYLGSLGVKSWYGVRIFGSELNKANGDEVKLSFTGDNYYQWKFRTSGALDVTPPQVRSIFPVPDNGADERSEVVGAKKASGTLTVTSAPVLARGASPTGYSCSYEGTVAYTRGAGTEGSGIADALTISTANPSLQNGSGLVRQVPIINNQAQLGCGVSIDVSNVTTGTDTKVTFIPAREADVVTIANVRLRMGEDVKIADSAQNLTSGWATALAAEINRRLTTVQAAAADRTVTVTAIAAGAAGNTITLASSNTSAISVTPMGGGTDQELTQVVNSRPDVAKNATVQINFNEAMNPLFAAGDAEAVSNWLQVRCTGPECTGDRVFTCGSNTCVKGEFLISNSYRTVELRTNNRCGENSCGEDVFCLPESANITVWVRTADLNSCQNDASCAGPAGANGRYGTCDTRLGICREGQNGKHYSQAANKTAPNGLVDAAFNGMDGDKNFDAEGPRSTFNENLLLGACARGSNNGTLCTYDTASVCQGGNAICTADGSTPVPSFKALQDQVHDNYQWSFWTSNAMQTAGPTLTGLNHNNQPLLQTAGTQTAGIATEGEVRASFDTLMLSSSLKPGRNYPNDYYVQTGNDTAQRSREYLVFAKFTGRPLGYWVKKEDGGFSTEGYAENTTAIVGHTPFAESDAYGFVAGSGLKDVYQNCYNPAKDENTAASSQCGSLNDTTDVGKSCCQGIVNNDAAAVCYDFQ